VNISLDTMKRDRFAFITGVDAFNDVIKGIEKATIIGLDPIKLNTVIIKGFNDDEIIAFVKAAKKWNHHVRFIEFMPFGETSLWNSAEIITSQQIEDIIRTAYNLVPSLSNNNGPARMFDIEGGSGKIGVISPLSTHICSVATELGLIERYDPALPFFDTEYD
jgi:cyclic pyranopterin phosphate synthase